MRTVKKIIMLSMVTVMLLMLSACGKSLEGSYSAFSNDRGKVNLDIDKDGRVKMVMETMIKVEKQASEGLFAGKPYIAQYKLKGKVDEKEKKIKLTNEEGLSNTASYELKGDVLKLELTDNNGKTEFYKVDSDAYKKAEKNFDEEAFLGY